MKSDASGQERTMLRHCNTGRTGAVPLAVTAGLLALFLGGACGKPSSPAAVVTGDADKQGQGLSAPGKQAEPRFIAYYFHRTLRCPTCLAIEKTSRETIEAHFKDALSDGRLAWRAVNMETPADRHFEKDFQLEAQALVLVEMKHDKVAASKNLSQVWDLIDKPPEFQEYVRSEVAAFISR